MNVAVIVFPDPFMSSAQLRGVIRFAASAHWSIRVWSTGQAGMEAQLQRWRPRGVIANVADPAREMPFWRRLRRPKVYMLPPAPEQTPCADVDNWQVGRMGFEHLANQGYTTAAFCGSSESWATARFAGFTDAAKLAGRISLDNRNADGAFPASSAVYRSTSLRKWLCRLPRPVGIMAAADDIAVAVVRACEQLGYRVPEDVAVLGVDNRELLCFSRGVPFSSIAPDYERVGFAAAHMLADQIAGRPLKSRVTLIPPIEVVSRRSTEVAASGDLRMVTALKAIRSGEVRSVAQVIERTQISRSWLEQQFRQTLGRSPGREIRRARIERARQFLTETDLDLAAVAVRAGFANLPHMSNAFRIAFGLPPGEYRRQQAVTRSALR